MLLAASCWAGKDDTRGPAVSQLNMLPIPNDILRWSSIDLLTSCNKIIIRYPYYIITIEGRERVSFCIFIFEVSEGGEEEERRTVPNSNSDPKEVFFS
jgi:hypothetical protein